MIVDLPDTTTSAVSKALVKIREEGGAVALGRVLTLVIATPLGEEEEAIEAANDASREHPMRVIVVSTARSSARSTTRRASTPRSASAATPARARSSCCAPTATPPPTRRASSRACCCPTRPSSSGGRRCRPRFRARRRSAASPSAASRMPPTQPTRWPRCATLGANYTPGDTDFAWTRLTLWRAQLAAVLDQPPYEPVTGVSVSGAADSPSTDAARGVAAAAARGAGRATSSPTRERSQRHPRGAPRARDRARSSSTATSADVATLVQPDQPTHSISLPRRNLRDCLADELRRLDPDELYGEVIQKRPRPADSTRVDRAEGAREEGRMTNERRVLVHPDKAALAGSRRRAVHHQDRSTSSTSRSASHVVLTGGSMGAAVLEAIDASPARDSVDWSRVTFWWGDERWLPHGDPERNDTQARAALLDHLALPRSACTSFPASGEHADIEAAALAYAAELAASAVDGGAYPRLRHHVPRRRAGRPHRVAVPATTRASGRPSAPCIAVRTRPSRRRERLTPHAAGDQRVASASGSCWPVPTRRRRSVSPSRARAANEVPAAGVKGRKRTVFFVDQEAAAEVPETWSPRQLLDVGRRVVRPAFSSRTVSNRGDAVRSKGEVAHEGHPVKGPRS